jgi:FkbM family methyltransferase
LWKGGDVSALSESISRTVSRVFCNPITGAVVEKLWPESIPSIRGGRYAVRPSGFPTFQRASILFGTFEGPERYAAERYLNPDLDTLELGSGIGFVSCAIAKRLKPGRKLIVVEPDRVAFALTTDNLKRNAPSATVTTINACIDYGKELSVTTYGTFIATPDERTSTAATTLREVVGTHFTGPYQLVMDIEGAELGLILSDREALSSCTTILAEFHSSSADGQLYHDLEMIEVLKGYGFNRCMRIGHGANYLLQRQ